VNGLLELDGTRNSSVGFSTEIRLQASSIQSLIVNSKNPENFERLNLNWCTVLAVRMLRGFKDSGNMTAVEYDAFAMHMMCLPSFRVAPALKLNMNLRGHDSQKSAIQGHSARLRVTWVYIQKVENELCSSHVMVCLDVNPVQS